MRITRIAIAAGMIASSLALAGCLDDGRPGRWGDHHHGRHHGDHRGDHHDHDWRR